MIRPLVVTSALLFASAATANELYLPLAPSTQLRLANPSAHAATVSVECGTATQFVLAAGESIEWTRPNERCTAARISADAAVRVDATTPLFDRDDASDEGSVTIGARPVRSAWQRGVGFINPENVPVAVTLSRGETLEIPARGTRFVATDNESLTYRAPHDVVAFLYATNEESGAQVFAPATRRRRRAVRSPGPPPGGQPQTITLAPSKDTTLFEDANESSSRSNSLGANIFAGAILNGELRRAALAFDVASQIPPGSQITSVALQFQLTKTIAGPHPMQLRAIAQSWGEGTSNAGSSRDGAGSLARNGDATWLHASFPDRRWSKAGGDFAATADATVTAAADLMFPSSAALVARVQGWVDQPATNFGWMLLGNENEDTTVKRYGSREHLQENRPKLTVTFIPRL